MFKKWFYSLTYIFIVLFLCVNLSLAEKPHDMTHMTDLWIGDDTDTADVTPGDNDLFVSGTAEIDGATRIDGAVDINSTLDVSGSNTFATGSISATEIADITRSFSLPLGAAFVDGTGPITATSTPNLTTLDNIAAILYDTSAETTGVSWTFRLPSDYSTDLGFYVLVSSDDASGAGTKLDYQFFVNNDDTGFASATAQTEVECTSATLDASNEVLHLNPDATAEALFTSGAWITLEIFNASTNDDDLEIKGVEAYYTATQ